MQTEISRFLANRPDFARVRANGWGLCNRSIGFRGPFRGGCLCVQIPVSWRKWRFADSRSVATGPIEAGCSLPTYSADMLAPRRCVSVLPIQLFGWFADVYRAFSRDILVAHAER